MSRIPLSAVAILAFVTAWIVAAVLIADELNTVHWALKAVYFVTAGFVWVFPVRWLMLWGAHQR